jgi:signal transduction histidine kinase
MNNEKMLKILMLEDSGDDINLIERVLRKNNLSFVSKHVDTRDQFTDSIRSFQPDVILSDHGLPQFNSMEALKISMKERSFVPFIIVTGTMSDEFAISCLQEGADDYILKSNLSRLPAAIVRAVKERKLEKLKREARHALRRQNAELMKVNKELDNFVYSVSHNLRGPLASVLGLLSIAKLENTEQQLDPIHSMMDASIRKLDETLKEILDFSRNARSEIHSEEVLWDLIIEKILARFEYLPNYKSLNITWDVQASIPFYSDRHRLRAILINLLSNAIAFVHRERESVITVEIHTSEKAASLTIRDNGIGIPEENISRVFDMFYRGTEVSQGAGLGLYITKEIVKKLNGDIQISSVPVKETTVTVTIPNSGVTHHEG